MRVCFVAAFAYFLFPFVWGLLSSLSLVMYLFTFSFEVAVPAGNTNRKLVETNENKLYRNKETIIKYNK